MSVVLLLVTGLSPWVPNGHPILDISVSCLPQLPAAGLGSGNLVALPSALCLSVCPNLSFGGASLSFRAQVIKSEFAEFELMSLFRVQPATQMCKPAV